MQILDRYITRTFLSTFGVVLLFVLGIFILIHSLTMVNSLLDEREKLATYGYTFFGVFFQYYAVSLPFIFLQLAPFVTVIAATIALIRLMRGNELTAMIAAGRSPGRITLPIFVCGGLIAVSMLAMQQWVVPRLADSMIRLDRVKEGDFEGTVDKLPFLTDGAGNTWSIERWLPDSSKIEGVTILRFKDPESGEVVGDLFVPVARYREEGPDGPGWYPQDGRLVVADGSWVRSLSAEETIPTDLLPEAIALEVARGSREAGKMLSLSEAARMVERYPDLPHQRVAFHALITWPLGTILLLFLGMPFILRMGERNLFVGVGVSLVLCASYFAVDLTCQELGSRATLPPSVATWLPVVVFASLSIALHDAFRS